MASQHFKVKATSSLLEIVNHLEHLIASLKEGTIVIKRNDETVILKPMDPVTLELEAEARLDKDALREKLIIELKWRKREMAPVEEGTFSISSQECSPEV